MILITVEPVLQSTGIGTIQRTETAALCSSSAPSNSGGNDQVIDHADCGLCLVLTPEGRPDCAITLAGITAFITADHPSPANSSRIDDSNDGATNGDA